MYHIDNNLVERSIRPIALGRKSWLFIKNDESGEDLAVISTLIQTCELLGLNPKDWFSKTFSKIARQNNYNPEPLLPYHYVRRKQISQSQSIKTLAYLFYGKHPMPTRIVLLLSYCY